MCFLLPETYNKTQPIKQQVVEFWATIGVLSHLVAFESLSESVFSHSAVAVVASCEISIFYLF